MLGILPGNSADKESTCNAGAAVAAKSLQLSLSVQPHRRQPTRLPRESELPFPSPMHESEK